MAAQRQKSSVTAAWRTVLSMSGTVDPDPVAGGPTAVVATAAYFQKGTITTSK